VRKAVVVLGSLAVLAACGRPADNCASGAIAVAVVIAALLYQGAIRFDLGKFFTVTGVLLVFVAAGVLSYGIHDLQEAAILPGLNTLAFDVSEVLPEDSWYGALLKGFFNYSQRTSVLQAIAWVAYVGVVLSVFLIRPRRRAAVSN